MNTNKNSKKGKNREEIKTTEVRKVGKVKKDTASIVSKRFYGWFRKKKLERMFIMN